MKKTPLDPATLGHDQPLAATEKQQTKTTSVSHEPAAAAAASSSSVSTSTSFGTTSTSNTTASTTNTESKLLPVRFPLSIGAEGLSFEKSQLVEELEKIERELREKAQSSAQGGNASGSQSSHTTSLGPAAAAVLTHIVHC